MGSRTRQIEEQDRELLKFHERIGDLWLKAENLKEQLEIERADRKDIEEEYWEKVEVLTELRSQLSELQQNLATANQQLEEVTADRAQLQAELDSTKRQYLELLETSASRVKELQAEQNPPPAIDLLEQVGEIVNFLKELLPPDTKWPKRVIPSLRKFLESKEEKNEPD